MRKVTNSPLWREIPPRPWGVMPRRDGPDGRGNWIFCWPVLGTQWDWAMSGDSLISVTRTEEVNLGDQLLNHYIMSLLQTGRI